MAEELKTHPRECAVNDEPRKHADEAIKTNLRRTAKQKYIVSSPILSRRPQLESPSSSHSIPSSLASPSSRSRRNITATHLPRLHIHPVFPPPNDQQHRHANQPLLPLRESRCLLFVPHRRVEVLYRQPGLCARRRVSLRDARRGRWGESWTNAERGLGGGGEGEESCEEEGEGG